MDKQRIMVYGNLIEQLLSCESGSEVTLLQQHSELVDAGLLEVIEQYADLMATEGDTGARWLRQGNDTKQFSGCIQRSN